jgi:1,2-diacylglycerol-3-alpha-glucose alpha-1,2-galactosyltransferase
MVDLYNMADVLFMPSYNELFPMTILEAVNAHVPLVLRDLDLYHEILFDHYMRADENLEFARMIDRLHKEPELYHDMQEQSKKISEYYSKENVLEMWEKFYLDAYEEKKRQ